MLRTGILCIHTYIVICKFVMMNLLLSRAYLQPRRPQQFENQASCHPIQQAGSYQNQAQHVVDPDGINITKPRKGTRFRRDISSQGPGHTDRQAPCSMQMPHGVTPQQMHTSQGLHPRAKAPYWPPPRHSLTHTRQAEALELRCPGKVHGPPATTTTGVKTQPKARPKQALTTSIALCGGYKILINPLCNE